MLPSPGARGADADQVVVVRSISWEHYIALDEAIEDGTGPRIAYLDGELEIMTTSFRHEVTKKLLARLVETFAEETGIALNGYGHTTQRNETERVAAEPDESYSIGKRTQSADLVIEVVHTSGGLDKLEVFRRLGAREVWFWINQRLWVFVLVDAAYQERLESEVLPGIDLRHIERLVTNANDDDQTETIRAYRASLRARS
jgi:Uma2 family endonuclease